MVDEPEVTRSRPRRAAPHGQRPRRSPPSEERRRDPERSRERILDAALVEFGEHGFAGARISAIARRAGVNHQLISYYFDGKEGLYRALAQRWREVSGTINHQGATLAEIVGGFVRINARQRHWARLLIWESLSGRTDPDGPAFFADVVEDLRRRQRAGELAADIDPAYLLLAMFGASFAPTALPQVTEGITGQAPDSAAFVETYCAQLAVLITHLAGGPETVTGG